MGDKAICFNEWDCHNFLLKFRNDITILNALISQFDLTFLFFLLET
jgi:hypothetical protein